MIESIINASNVKYRYSRIHRAEDATDLVLDGFSLRVKEGEIVGIIGPNGSGKTTALKLISRILRPESGNIELMGKNIAYMKQKEIAKLIAVVPQGASVSFPFTVREVVLMGRSPHLGALQMERSSDFRIADNAMALTDSLDIADRNIDDLSGGERQRVIIARALTQEPKIMLLDEPSSYLDINHQVEIFDLIKRLNSDRNLTVIIVSHDLNMASEYCERLVLMKNGRVYKDGTPREVITESNIRDVYGASVIITDNILTGAPHIIPISKLMSRKYKQHFLKIHVIGGGGTGTKTMRWLAIEGYHVTAGVLNISDSDYKIARSLEIEIVPEAPFSHISEEAHSNNMEKAQNADVVIVTRVPIGFGNLKNMVAALSAQESGAKVILFDNFDGMDYTNGRATKIYDELVSNGAIVISDESEINNILVSMEA